MDTLSDSLAGLEPEHARALEWFVEHEGDIGARPWRVEGESVVPGVTVPIVAQRGIHVPSEWNHALSVTATRASSYGDGEPIDAHDGTWLLQYDAHAGGDGSGGESRWNRGLLACWLDRVPTGVFLQVPAGDYRNLGLALVESYDETTGHFLLRGPLRYSQPAAQWERDESLTDVENALVAMEGAAEDGIVRIETLMAKRERQQLFRRDLLKAYRGACAVTLYDAPEALQAAHILNYSGRSSQRVDNGLLLRADIHSLFDRHLISIDPSGMLVRVAPQLSRTAYSALDGHLLSVPRTESLRPSVEGLSAHWQVFGKAWA